MAQPGAVSSGLPDANPAAGLAYSPGNDSAEPGIPGPRRPASTAPTAARTAVWPDRAAAPAARAWSAVISRAAAISASSSASSRPGGGALSGSSYSSRSPGASSSATAAR